MKERAPSEINCLLEAYGIYNLKVISHEEFFNQPKSELVIETE